MADDDEMDVLDFDTTPIRRQNRGALLTPSIHHNNSMRLLCTNGERRQNGGAKKLKRHDTDPSMGKGGHPPSIRSKLSSPQSSNCMENNDTLLNVPISRDRASPSVGSIQSDPESCIDGYFMDDDDDTLIVPKTKFPCPSSGAGGEGLCVDTACDKRHDTDQHVNIGRQDFDDSTDKRTTGATATVPSTTGGRHSGV